MTRLIPVYELYGELLSGGLSDPVHHETIFERSSQNDWTIRLHRHAKLLQIFLFRSAGVDIRGMDGDYHSAEPLVLVMPPGAPHGFRFPEAIDGDVLSIPLAEIPSATRARLEQLMRPSGDLLPRSGALHFDTADLLLRQIREVYHSMGSERGAILRALTQAVLHYLMEDLRHAGRIESPAGRPERREPSRHEAQAQAFCELVEAHFAQAMPIPDYADALAVSPPHLTRVCKRILGTSPNELIRKRRLLEAKRLLTYTRVSVQDVAIRAGFGDVTYFSRSFRKATGQTPSAFRQSRDD